MLGRGFRRTCRLIGRQLSMVVNSVMLSDRLSFGSSSSTSSSRSGKSQKMKKQQSPTSSQHQQQACDHCSTAAIDIIILILALGASLFLLGPYFKVLCNQLVELVPAALLFIGDIVYEAPVVYALAAGLTSVSVIGIWEIYQYKSRKCGNPTCKGLKNAMECDIQLETEECVKSSPPTNAVLLDRGLQLAQDQKELEAELKKMAPPNGRAVLVFRARCGCPAARFEVWGSKKPRRSKK